MKDIFYPVSLFSPLEDYFLCLWQTGSAIFLLWLSEIFSETEYVMVLRVIFFFIASVRKYQPMRSKCEKQCI